MSGRIKQSMELDGDIWKAILLWRNTPNKMDSSPAQRIFSRRTRCAVPVFKSKLRPKVIGNVKRDIINNRRLVKRNYDRRTRHLPDLEIGDPVYVQTKPQLNSVWEGGVVKEYLNSRSYVVDVADGQLRRNRERIKSTPQKVIPQPFISAPEVAVTSSARVDCKLDQPLVGKGLTLQDVTVTEPISSSSLMSRPKRTIKLPARYQV